MISAHRCVLATLFLAMVASPSSAQYQVGLFTTGMLETPQWGRELKVTEQQREAAREATRKAHAALEKSSQATRALPDAAKADAMMADRAKYTVDFEKEIASILKPEQMKRYRELNLQNMGASAFTEPGFQAALKMTDEQKARAAELADKRRIESKKISALPKDERRERTTAFLRESLQSAESILDDDQRKAYEAMRGEPSELFLH